MPRLVGVFVRSVLGALRRRAVAELSVAGGRSGGVAIIQRFGSALNVNVHAHALIVDGVYAEDEAGQLRFHGLAPPDEEAMHKVLGTIARRLGRLLARLGLLDDAADGEAHDRWADEMPLLAGLTAASVQGRVVLGPRAGGEVRRCGALLDLEPLPARDRACHACGGGFDLDASVSVASGNRERLERVCRYALRPPIAQDRVELTPGGDVRLRLRHPWRDGTTHVQFHPLELLERLATLTPRPRINLVLYYGVLAAHAAWRARVQSTSAAPGGSIGPSHDVAESRSTSAQAARGPGANRTWAQWMQRSFGLDVLACLRCGGRLRLVALIQDATVIRNILAHRGWPTEVPPPRPARAPPIGRGYSTAGVAGN